MSIFSKRSFSRFFGLGTGFFLLLSLFSLTFSPLPVVRAATYEIGPGKPYAQLSQVVNLLAPGDLVLVYANGTTPYKGVSFRNPGTSASPVTIRGVRDSNGKRPIISDQGVGGVTNGALIFNAGYYVFEGFEVTTPSTDAGGGPVIAFHPFRGPANSTRDITIKDVYLYDCPSHGFLSNDDTSGSMFLSHVEIARCGEGLYDHAIYLTTGVDNPILQNAVVQIQYSYIHDSRGGNLIKLRSKFNKIYYNWLESPPDNGSQVTYYELQLIGPDDGSGGSAGNPRNSDVVGNVFVKNNGLDSSVQVGGDGTGASFGQNRFVNNTWLLNGTRKQAINVRYRIKSLELENNVFANRTGGGVTVVGERDGPNWLSSPRPLTGKANWVAANSLVPPEFQNTVVGTSNDPGFISLAGLDLRPNTGSALLNNGTATPLIPAGNTFPLPFALPTFEPPVRQAKQNLQDARASDGAIDIGAFEANTPPVIETNSYFHNVTPARLYDSRPAGTNNPNPPLGVGQGVLAPGDTTVRTIQVTGNLGVPSGAKAVLANLTVADAVAGGNLKVFPADRTSTNTASINWYQSSNGLGPRVVSNFAIINLSPAGAFKIQTESSSANVIVDIFGYVNSNITGGGVYKALTNPTFRLYDSRAAGSNTPNPPLGVGQGALLKGSGTPNSRNLQVTGNLGIPATATAVIVNLTAVGVSKGGFFNLYPTGGTVPNVSNLNWNDPTAPGTNRPRDIANLAIVPLSSSGQMTIGVGGNDPATGANIIVDVVGYVDSATGATTGFYNRLTSPSRLYDSRVGQGPFPGSSVQGVLAPLTTRSITATVLGVPTNAKSVVVRVTTVNVSGGGNLALYPGPTYPGNSTVNMNGANQQIGNLTIVNLDATGKFLVRNGSSLNATGFVLDLIGFTV
jgi:hypothetical protein